jgi:hypothetical protein
MKEAGAAEEGDSLGSGVCQGRLALTLTGVFLRIQTADGYNGVRKQFRVHQGGFIDGAVPPENGLAVFEVPSGG